MITTHVLDVSRGRPAVGVRVILDRRQADGSWSELARGQTNADGRLASLMQAGSLTAATYRLRFATGDYFAAMHVRGFYPEVEVTFVVEDPTVHYHVPLLLSPFGYSTYRGS